MERASTRTIGNPVLLSLKAKTKGRRMLRKVISTKGRRMLRKVISTKGRRMLRNANGKGFDKDLSVLGVKASIT